MESIKDDLEEKDHTRTIKEAEKSIENLEKLSEKTQKAKEIFETYDRTIKKIDIKKILEEVKKEVLSKYPSAEINIQIDIKKEIGVYTSIEKALYELIENAIKHNDSEIPKAYISVTEEENNIKIEIKDNGVAIPENEKEVLKTQKETH